MDGEVDKEVDEEVDGEVDEKVDVGLIQLSLSPGSTFCPPPFLATSHPLLALSPHESPTSTRLGSPCPVLLLIILLPFPSRTLNSMLKMTKKTLCRSFLHQKKI